MSIVALADGNKSSVTLDVLHDIARQNNITITNKSDEEAYLLVLQSADVTFTGVDELPDYIDPRLTPIPTTERKFWKSENNSLNAWSHQTNFSALQPTSDLLKGRKIVLKDNISVAGVPYTAGTFPQFASKTGEFQRPVIDATVVQRLLLAGATIVGISTCENYSLTPLSYTSATGPVHNPWLRNYNTGGSSSGSACLLALGTARAAGVPGLEDAGEDVDLAMGGDQAGSIRGPSGYCGVYGLKPTHGLVPYTGIAGLSPMIDHAGPMARTLEDVALILTTIAGYDGLDHRMTPESPLRANVPQYHDLLTTFTSSLPTTNPGQGLKVAIITESLTSPGTNPTVASIVQSAATNHFTATGATVTPISLPIHLLAPAIWASASRPQMASIALSSRTPDNLSHSLPHFTPRWPPDQEIYDLQTHHNPAIINVLFNETFHSSKFGPETQAKAHRHVLQLRAAYDKVLEEYDVLITPTNPFVAPPHPDMRKESEGGSTLMDKIRMAVGATNNTCPFNATGHPALNVPCGWAEAQAQAPVGAGAGVEVGAKAGAEEDAKAKVEVEVKAGAGPEEDANVKAEGRERRGMLPVGMQIIGKRWDDLGVLKAARIFELGGGGLGVWPGLAS